MSTFQKVLAWLGGGVALLVVYYYWHLLGVTNSREIYLVPAGYRGIVYILFNQPAGAPPEHEGFRRSTE